jgi:hypothetical protein
LSVLRYKAANRFSFRMVNCRSFYKFKSAFCPVTGAKQLQRSAKRKTRVPVCEIALLRSAVALKREKNHGKTRWQAYAADPAHPGNQNASDTA